VAGARPPATTSPPSDPLSGHRHLGPRRRGDTTAPFTARHHPWETRAHPPGAPAEGEHHDGQARHSQAKKKANPLKAAKVENIDYKDAALLRKFISDRGKIRARRVTGVSVQEQRLIANAVKNAREMALLPYSSSSR
jgi:small subunit ribosomal protein S18